MDIICFALSGILIAHCALDKILNFVAIWNMCTAKWCIKCFNTSLENTFFNDTPTFALIVLVL